ncbi:hypothetical protein S40285_10870 [Stachybotrys chlorohalonatus IBT 40285]|uniref:Uncharacterized protein n=1 Tax=Stachybotrys chlorohalonatus (strain IBT 40285) TaxID=1283841 RepID=A0A084QZF9_STAC4|nr:hypothetical protein S40285_10870 [Stachybotrys chlorohalonata IBT 40285]
MPLRRILTMSPK